MSEHLPPIRLAPGCSRALTLLFSIVYGGSVLLLLSVDLDGWVKIAGTGIVVAAFVLAFRHHVLHVGKVVALATLHGDGSWLLQLGDDTESRASLEPYSVVLPWFSALNFRLTDGRRRALLLMPDNIDHESFRQLRVRLLNT